MAAASAKLPYEDFQAPPGDEIAGVLSSVPDVAGQSVEAATAALQAAGFTVADGGQVNSETGAGLVAYTSPAAGGQLSSGDTVTLYTSTGYVPPPPSADNNGGGNGRGAPEGPQPSCLRTSAATAPPSARPLTWGVTTPMTLPIARIPSPAAPVCSIAAVTRSAK